ncbi:group II intron reverse transcriptase/maturase [Burkholderia mayonis]|uniref:Group II intron reverse transcriptase/maturase n=1 Tax=Burkholderia mayonis TaxID=1385591 RepID=A0A1B4G7L0_9BURK|nr:group II intron reverse transcriptase/maturase [Burkholderia mayonis]KVE56259.1 group II intron reverse transcriptase/maturase [Burkholderia mayonis]
MHGREKSDSAIVAMKPANKAASVAAERVEPRVGTEGNANQTHTRRAQNRGSVSQGLERVRQLAKQHKKMRFTTLLHHVTVERLSEAFYALKRKASPGVDGVTWQSYETGLERNLRDLNRRVHTGSYRALPVLRRYIPKGDGGLRPLGVAALEDKLVQSVMVDVLNAIYEEDFLGFSYGFRPGRNQHDALDALAAAIQWRPVNWILDSDIQSFFDTVNRQWLIRFVKHQVADPRVIRLIGKWLDAGVLDDGRLTSVRAGTPQGSVISPLLANIYLHYVFDLWIERWRRQRARGTVIVSRYADDTVVGFQYETDALLLMKDLRQRMEEFDLSLHPEKTRLLEFGRYAADRRKRKGMEKPETFAYLGFTHISGKSRNGAFQLKRKSRKDRLRAKLKQVREQMRRRMHESIASQGRWLAQIVRGYFAYHAVPTNIRALRAFRHGIMDIWRRTLRRRSQKDTMTWQRIQHLADEWLPQPQILHAWPDRRFAVNHPRWEPNA